MCFRGRKRLFFHGILVAGGVSELCGKTGGEVGGRIETYPVSHFLYGVVSGFQQRFGFLQTNQSDEEAGCLAGKGFEFSVQIFAAHVKGLA